MAQKLIEITETPLELWRALPYLNEVPIAAVVEMAAAGSRRVYAAGQQIFGEGDPVAGLFLIEEGTVKVSRYSRDGREYILLFLTRGETFNDVAVLDGGPNPATATAHTDVVAWQLGRAELRQVVERHPSLAWAMLENLARRARYLVGKVQDLSMRSVRGRLARLLLDQAEMAEGGRVPRLLTQEDMASQLGTVREVVGRALRGLAADGIIEFDRHRIVILDRRRLAKEAEA